MLKSIIAAIGLLALAGCAGNTVAPPAVTPSTVVAPAPVLVAAPVAATPLSQLQSFTLADLVAASADAGSQTPPDATAKQCYDFLIQVLPTIKGPTAGQTVGAIVAFQKLRDLQNGVASSNGVLKSLNLACAPLVIDTQAVINKLVLLGAGSAATGGALGPTATGINSLLPIPLP